MGLLTYEQKLDALISRKKMEIQEVLKRPLKIKRKLRIYVSHSFVPGKEPEVWKLIKIIANCLSNRKPIIKYYILHYISLILEGNRRRCYPNVGIAGGRSTIG